MENKYELKRIGNRNGGHGNAIHNSESEPNRGCHERPNIYVDSILLKKKRATAKKRKKEKQKNFKPGNTTAFLNHLFIINFVSISTVI